jgi:uncharacterized protein (TIGR02231 family)
MSTPEIKSTVSKVTVYTDRAMVTRLAKTRLSGDSTQVVIGNLPPNLNEESLRISGRGTAGMTILDFKVARQEYREVPEAALKTLEEEKVKMQDEIAALRDDVAAIEHQKGFLKEIGVGKSKHISKDLDVQRPSLDDWKSVLEFLGTEQRSLDEARRANELKIRKLEADLRLMDAELKKYAGVRSKVRKIVTIELELKGAGEFEFDLAYLVYEASWKPLYDARVDSRAKQVGIRYCGLVEQRTGEDWAGVEVLLSTARPQIDGNAPALHAWYVMPYTMPTVRAAPASARGAMNKKMAAEEADMEEGFGGGGGAMMVGSVQAPASMASATVESGQGSAVAFRTPSRGDIPGDGGPTKLLILDGDFENKFQYLSVPKLAEQVYLTAEITNSTEFPLLPGRISIFLDGNFVGNSDLAAVTSPSEKFVLHLGVDDSIKIRRKLQKRKGDEKGLFSRSHTEEFSFLITLESHRETAEEIVVQDHIPVSTDEKIKIEVRTLTPAENPEKDKDKLPNGTVEWKLQLAAKATEKLELGFVVSYPKDLEVSGL